MTQLRNWKDKSFHKLKKLKNSRFLKYYKAAKNPKKLNLKTVLKDK